MTEAALLAPTEGTLPLNRRDPKGFRGWYLVGKKTWKEEQDGRERLTRLLILLTIMARRNWIWQNMVMLRKSHGWLFSGAKEKWCCEKPGLWGAEHKWKGRGDLEEGREVRLGYRCGPFRRMRTQSCSETWPLQSRAPHVSGLAPGF